MSENREFAHEIDCSIQVNSRHGCNCMVGVIENQQSRIDKLKVRNTALLSSNSHIMNSYMEKKQQLKTAVEALEKMNNVAPPMYEYNNIELEIIMLVRKALEKIKGGGE